MNHPNKRGRGGNPHQNSRKQAQPEIQAPAPEENKIAALKAKLKNKVANTQVTDTNNATATPQTQGEKNTAVTSEVLPSKSPLKADLIQLKLEALKKKTAPAGTEESKAPQSTNLHPIPNLVGISHPHPSSLIESNVNKSQTGRGANPVPHKNLVITGLNPEKKALPQPPTKNSIPFPTTNLPKPAPKTDVTAKVLSTKETIKSENTFFESSEKKPITENIQAQSKKIEEHQNELKFERKDTVPIEIEDKESQKMESAKQEVPEENKLSNQTLKQSEISSSNQQKGFEETKQTQSNLTQPKDNETKLVAQEEAKEEEDDEVEKEDEEGEGEDEDEDEGDEDIEEIEKSSTQSKKIKTVEGGVPLNQSEKSPSSEKNTLSKLKTKVLQKEAEKIRKSALELERIVNNVERQIPKKIQKIVCYAQSLNKKRPFNQRFAKVLNFFENYQT